MLTIIVFIISMEKAIFQKKQRLYCVYFLKANREFVCTYENSSIIAYSTIAKYNKVSAKVLRMLFTFYSLRCSYPVLTLEIFTALMSVSMK